PELGELRLEDLAVRRVVVDREDARARERRDVAPDRPLHAARGAEADGEVEGRAAPRLARNADPAAHELDELLRDREPETGAAVAPRRRRVDLAERPEEPLAALGGDPDPRVADLEAEHGVVALAPVDPSRRDDLALGGELDPVRDQVEE